MERCKWCPVSEACDNECVAQKFNSTSLCDKVNPEHPSFKEAYKIIIADKSCGTRNYIPTGKKPRDGKPKIKLAAPSETSEEIPANSEPQKLPSLFKQAKNFGSALVKHVKGGMKTVPDKIFEERIETCHKCDFFIEEGSRCGKCGCALLVKCKWASSKCPLTPPKWDAIEENSQQELKIEEVPAVKDVPNQITVSPGCGKCH